jgi:hypothetical protein
MQSLAEGSRVYFISSLQQLDLGAMPRPAPRCMRCLTVCWLQRDNSVREIDNLIEKVKSENINNNTLVAKAKGRVLEFGDVVQVFCHCRACRCCRPFPR